MRRFALVIGMGVIAMAIGLLATAVIWVASTQLDRLFGPPPLWVKLPIFGVLVYCAGSLAMDFMEGK